MKRIVLFFAVLALVVTFASTPVIAQEKPQPVVAIPSTIQLPENLTIFVPDSAVPREQAAFSGKWYGVWDGILEHILVVEEVRAGEALVVYAYGVSPVWKFYKPGWWRSKGNFKSGSLVLETQRATITYRMNSNNTLSATYEMTRSLVRARAQLVKIE